MKLNKKALLSLGTLASIVAPIAATVSCGSATGGGFDGRYDTANETKVVVHSTWSAGGSQYRAFSDLVNKYNEVQKNEAGFLPVELTHVEGGYGDAASSAITKITAHDTATLPNLIVDYPAGAAQMKAYEMQLDFKSDANGLDTSKIDANQLKFMNNIGGVKQDDVVAVPLAISTEMVFIDKPLMKHFFEVLKAKGANIDISQAGLVQDIDNVTIGADDKGAIDALWGTVASVSTDTSLSGYTVDNNTFKSYEGLIELGNKVMAATGKNAQDAKNLHFMGNDSPGNLEFVLTESLKAKAEYDAVVSKGADTFVKNDWYHGGKAKANMNKANDLIIGGLKTGSLWLGGGGEFGSNLFVEHKMALTVGSTAGYYHQFDKNTGNVSILALGANKKEELKGPSTAGQYDQIASYTNGHYKNSIKSFAHVMNSHDTHNVKTASAADDAKFNTATTNGDFITSNPDAANVTGATPITVKDFHNKDVTLYIIPHNSSAITQVSAGAKVNLADLLTTDNVALKATKDSTRSTLLPQGPGLIGVHSNAKGDKATTMFVNWLYSTTQVNFGDAANPNNMTPANYFAKEASYIVPAAGYLSKTYPHSPSLTNANASLQAAQTANNNIFFTEVPVDETSSPLRKYFESSLKAARDAFHTGAGTPTADSIYNEIKVKARASKLFG